MQILSNGRRIEINILDYGKVQKTVQKPLTGDDDNQIHVLAHFYAYPQFSIPPEGHELGISSSSVQKNCTHPYCKLLNAVDDILRNDFCLFMILKIFFQEFYDRWRLSGEGITIRRNQLNI